MGAYAAVRSLSKVLELSLVHHHDDQSLVTLQKEDLISLRRKVQTLLAFFEKNPDSEISSQIIDAAYQAEDIIESQLLSPAHLLPAGSDNMIKLFDAAETGCGDLKKVLEKFGFFLKEVDNIMTMKYYNAAGKIAPSDNSGLTYSSTSLGPTHTTVVGFDDEFRIVRDRIYRGVRDLQRVTIVGKPGVGKTTFARKLYEDAVNEKHFDRCGWAVVSQEFSRREVLLRLLQSICNQSSTHHDLNEKSDADLTLSLHKNLYGRRYLIVLDDIWSTKAIDDLNMIFPNQSNGSRVLLITRQFHVANSFQSANPPLELPPLSVEESWKLLEQRVFGLYPCPSQLKRIGKKIVRRCEGLPLAIVTVAGILVNLSTEKESWELVLEEISSEDLKTQLEISEISSSSYQSLPPFLRPCFLYLTAFPLYFPIDVNQLLWLWTAEGFVEPSGSKCSEEVAQDYLRDLIERDLLLVTKKRRDGTIKTVEISYASRYVGISKSREDRLHSQYTLGKSKGKLRRLSIQESFSLKCLSDIHDPVIRSLLVFVNYNFTAPTPVQNCRLLRVLHAPMAPLLVEPENMVYLRYLAIEFHKPELPKLLSELPNLETLLVQENRLLKETSHGLLVPLEVWQMPSLKHLMVGETCRLEKPPGSCIVKGSKLRTLSLVENLELNTLTTEMLTNIRSLKLHYSKVSEQGWERIQLSNLKDLEKLEELKISFSGCDDLPMGLAFPSSIQNMIGSLPDLRVLKLRKLWLPFGSHDHDWFVARSSSSQTKKVVPHKRRMGTS